MVRLINFILFPFAVLLVVLKGFFQFIGEIIGLKNLKHIPKAIAYLANDPSPFATSFDEIKFSHALIYATKNGEITKKSDNYFEFNTSIDGIEYYVKVSRATDGSNCALLRSHLI